MHHTAPDQPLRRACCAWLAATALPGAVAASEAGLELRGYTESFAPLSYEGSGEAQGFSSELLRLMAAEAGLPLRIDVLPWQRAVLEAAAQPASVLFSLVRLPEREARYRWVGPIARRHILVFRLTRRAELRVTRIAQLRGLRVGVARESAAAAQLVAAGLRPDVDLEFGLDDTQNLRKLLAGRMDAIVMLDWAADWQLRRLKLPPSTLTPVLPLDADQSYWFGLPADSDPLLARRLQDALDRIRQDGRYEAMRRRWFG